MVTVLKTAIICATIVAVVYLLMKSGDVKKDKDQNGKYPYQCTLFKILTE